MNNNLVIPNDMIKEKKETKNNDGNRKEKKNYCLSILIQTINKFKM